MAGRQSVMGQTMSSGSGGVGFSFRVVTIKEVEPDTNLCTGTDIRTTEEFQLGLDKRGSSSVWPQIGDTWLIDRSLGHWTLQSKITNTAPPSFTGATATMDPDLVRLVGLLTGMGVIQNATTAGVAPDYTWKTAALVNGWTPITTAQAPRYKLNPDSSVSIEGRTVPPTTVTNGMLVFTLPTAYRPPITKYDAVNVADGVAGNLVVANDGTVKIWDYGTATVTRLPMNMRFSLLP